MPQVKQAVKEEKKPEPKQEEKKSWFSFGFTKKEELKEEKKELQKDEKEVKSSVFTDSIFSKTIKEDKVEEFLWDLEVALLESDVALPVIDEIKDNLKKELVGKKVKIMQDIGEVVEESLRNAIAKALSIKPIDFDRFIETHEKPVVLMFVGVNGSGKTTTIARIAHRLKKKGYSCVIAAGDTFRAGAIEQLERHAEKLGVKLIKQKPGADPAAVAYDSIEHAKAHRKDVVLIDTAGRMQTNVNLMKEMEKIKRVSKPDLVIFVGDSLAGNDAIEQARKFNESVNIDAAILTKIDADAKGGAALSIAHAVGKPIIFVGVGQEYDDLIPFDPKWMVDRLFDSKGKEEAAA
ncbi:MAG: signal recognition particle-docking protein FtsY [Thermoplasmata archaeon]